ALNNNLGIDPEMSLKAMNYQKWLPSLSLGYQVSPTLEFYLNYGRSYMRPYAYVPIAMIYSKQRKKFQAADLTLQDIIDRWKLETADNFDFGCRFQQRWFSLAPTIFYASHHDLLFTTYDDQVGVYYHQNIGDATTCGVELECNIYPSDNLVLYINPSYTKATFSDNFHNTNGKTKTAGNDLPDTPRWLVKAGLTYRYKDFSISPSLKYVDQRYGDIENQEKIDDYVTVNLTADYQIENPWFMKKANLKIELTNIFDKKYVGSIKADDDGFKASQYYAGIPFTVICRINTNF
ncbi:MAG: TonB-dependent receptor, partial [Deltaproteobacteria bacterium]|nr:TonB-dependent receptor [Candidatus Tharpella sp.]